jgi:hypothetical protein
MEARNYPGRYLWRRTGQKMAEKGKLTLSMQFLENKKGEGR